MRSPRRKFLLDSLIDSLYTKQEVSRVFERNETVRARVWEFGYRIAPLFGLFPLRFDRDVCHREGEAPCPRVARWPLRASED